MTQWGFDFAWGYTPGFIAVLKANQAEFVCRYLSDPGGKGITEAEAQALIEAGIIVAPIWEVTGTDYTGGYNAGLADGQAAATALRGLGAPAGTYCWFAVDQGTSDTASTNNYLRGAKAGTAEFIAQLYGDYVVVEAAAAAGLGDCHWQTYAWSAGDISSHIAMYQYQNGVNVGGVSVDRTRTYKDLSGPWAHFAPIPAPVQPPPVPAPVPSPVPVQPPVEEEMPAGPISAPKGSWEAFSWPAGQVKQIIIVCGGWQEMQKIPPTFHLLINHNSGKFYLTDEITLPASGTYTYKIGDPSDCNGFAIWRVDGGDADGKAPLSYHTL